MIVIAAHTVAGMLAHPGHARLRFDAVLDQVAQAEADVVRFGGDAPQGRPVGVNIRYQ